MQHHDSFWWQLPESYLFLFSSLFAIHLLQLEPLFVSRLLSVVEWKETLTKLEATAHSRPEVVTAHRHQIGGRLCCLRRLVVHNACPARWNVTRLINVHLHSCEPGSQFWRSIVFRLQWRGWWALPACFCRARPPHCQGTPKQSLAQPAMKGHHSIHLLTHWKMNSDSTITNTKSGYRLRNCAP